MLFSANECIQAANGVSLNDQAYMPFYRHLRFALNIFRAMLSFVNNHRIIQFKQRYH